MRDPYAALGVEPGAGDEAVRRAYLGAIERHPPDTDPSGFAEVRAAYELVKDSRRRLELELFGMPPVAALADLAAGDGRPRHVGLEPWLRLIGGEGR